MTDMANRPDREAKTYPETDILFDPGDPAPEGVVQAWMEEIRSGRTRPVLLLARFPDSGYLIVDGRSRLEALKRLGLDTRGYDVIRYARPGFEACPEPDGVA
jgi:hypothetical protein